MSPAAWFNCQSGISGDMVLGALVDAGAPVDAVVAAARRVVPGGWELTTRRVERGGIAATLVTVTVEDQAPARPAGEVIDLVAAADLPAGIAGPALAALRALAEAEATVHRVPVDTVHLHEAGAVDAVVDVVGSAAAAHELGIDAFYSSPVTTGSGATGAAHGAIPVPAPAVVELLKGAPVRISSHPAELVTPTGAALLRGFGASFVDVVLVPQGQGFGAGGRDPTDRANVLQVVIGAAVGARTPMVLLEATIDDATPEVLAHTAERALEAGGADAWMTPVTMKKGRAGTVLSVLASHDLAGALEGLMLRESGTFGVRRTTVDRLALQRDWVTVEVGGLQVRVKRALLDGEVLTWAAEFEDARSAASQLGLPLQRVMAEAVAKARVSSAPS